MEKNVLRKELLLSKVDAKFSHYCGGNLYYTVETIDGLFQFVIETIEPVVVIGKPEVQLPFIKLSSDLGNTSFDNEIKASLLWRWIDKSIDKNEFIKVK